jgi:hypothetical protein
LVTFTNAESKWFPLLKNLYDLNSKKLGLNILSDNLKPKHVANLIQFDPITCAQYYDHHMRYFRTLCMKDNSILGHFLIFFPLLHDFKVVEVNMTMDFYGLQMHQFVFLIQTMQLKTLWKNIYHVIIIN